MGERKTPKQDKRSRKLVEVDDDVHVKLLEISHATGRPLRELASTFLRDALKHNVITFSPGGKINIPGVDFGYDIDTREFLYKKDGGEWTPMGK